MKTYQLRILQGFTTALWTIGALLFTLALIARGDQVAAIHLYGLGILFVTIAATCSVWLVMDSIATRVANKLRDELADAVGIALCEHMAEQQERRLYLTRR